MKPTPQIQQRNFPLTDYPYQATAEAVETASTLAQKKIRLPHLRASWRISHDYFGAEATRDFVAELFFFGWITAVAAWPVGVMLHQLVHWII